MLVGAIGDRRAGLRKTVLNRYISTTNGARIFSGSGDNKITERIFSLLG